MSHVLTFCGLCHGVPRDYTSYPLLKSYLKRINDGHEKKKAEALGIEHVRYFVENLDNSCQNLLYKVLALAALFTADRSVELSAIRFKDVSINHEDSTVKIVSHRQKVNRGAQTHMLVSTETINVATLFELYIISVRKTLKDFDGEARFFRQVDARTKSFKNQVVGSRYLSKVSVEIARFNGLEKPERYTGHGFRALSVTSVHENGGTETMFALFFYFFDHSNIFLG